MSVANSASKENNDTHSEEGLARKKSDPDTLRKNFGDSMLAAELPWGSMKVVPLSSVEYVTSPSLFAAKIVMCELFNAFERKLQSITHEDALEKSLSKCSQLNDDPYVENLLHTLNGLCEYCLPTVLSTLLLWYENQVGNGSCDSDIGDKRILIERRQLAADSLLCTTLIEILPQLHYFPDSCDQSVNRIVNLAFKQVAYHDPQTAGPNYNNYLYIAERYAEVLGVLSQSHPQLIQNSFLSNLSELKKETQITPSTVNNIISLLMAMKFFRVKTSQVSDFEMGIRFLDELGQYYLEVKHRDIKNAVAGLLVEILLPVAAQIKTEANIPAVISFVDRLYGPTFELVNKKRDKMAAYPLLTCLLCISQSKFFLSNWTQFLASALASLKNKDVKVSRVALESLYRLLWVYVIRNNCEGNATTRTRLESVCNSLFPKGNRAIIPRDAPQNIFVRIIHFIAQQKLDFAFKEIIFDLLGCNRTHSAIKTSIYPERMNIGIRALMVIANGLQQKEGPPDMPRSMGSGTTQRIKKTYISRPLTADIARSIGLEQYYAPCRKAFDMILRSLDSQVGKPLMLTSTQIRGKEAEELLTADVKPKLDLFRTCIAAIPRLLPDSMSQQEVVELLTRMSVHVDDELRMHAGQTLQTLIGECPEWREDIIHANLNFLTNHMQDAYPTLLDASLRLLHQLLFTWRSAVTSEKRKESNTSAGTENGFIQTSKVQISPLLSNSLAYSLHSVEGFTLAMLCQTRSQPRKIAVSILKEVRQLMSLTAPHLHETPVIDVLDSATPYILAKYIEHISASEKQFWTADFTYVCDKIGSIETDTCLVNSDRGNEYFRWDPWACALSGYCEYRFLVSQCPAAVAYAWPVVNVRLSACNNYVDPNNPQNENRASLLRTSKSKATSSSLCGEALGQGSFLSLWQKYLVMACGLAPSPPYSVGSGARGFSPTSSTENDLFRSLTSSVRMTRVSSLSCVSLFQKVLPMLRWEQMTDMRDSVVLGIGSTNPLAFECLLEEMKPILRDVMERKTENNARRKKRKDLLRKQVIRLIEVAIFRGVLERSGCLDSEGSLSPVLVDLLMSMRNNLESDQDRDMSLLTNIRLHFAKTVALLINSVPLDRRKNLIPNDKKHDLFVLFTSWCSRSIASSDRRRDGEIGTYVEQRAIEAMCALLCCGPVFEPSKALGEGGYLYGWLETLLDSTNRTVENLVEETLSAMLDLNDGCTQLLDWTINMCYTKPTSVAAKCFRSLVTLFSRREYPCEFDSVFVLCQVLSSNSDSPVSEWAVELLHLLRRQFLDESVTVNSVESEVHSFTCDQLSVCHSLAKMYPKFTMSVFSEVCYRIDNAQSCRRSALFAVLSAWIKNIQLVDSRVESKEKPGLSDDGGWGSEETTQLILNNLMQMTATYSVEHSSDLCFLWNTLASSHSSNLPIIVNYLFIMGSLSPDVLLSHTKRICYFLMVNNSAELITTLIDHLQNVNEQFSAGLERCELLPFYRWQSVAELAEKGRGGSSNHSECASEETVDAQNANDALSKGEPASEDTSLGIHQLPMPAYGGYISSLFSFLPPTTQPILSFSRSNLAMIHLCDLIKSGQALDWREHIELLMHIAILGLDSPRSCICRHARKTVINIVLFHTNKNNVSIAQVANILLINQIESNTKVISDSRVKMNTHGETPTFSLTKCNEYRQTLLRSNALFTSESDLVQAVVFCMSENVDRPLWLNEDVTIRQWRIESAETLGYVVRHLAEFLLDKMPLFAVKWTQLAMEMALSTSNRHIAGRCFQIASALCQSPSPWIAAVLSRLVETVGESHEDTQSYLTDVMLCLHTTVSHLSVSSPEPLSHSPSHARSTSYTPALLRQTAVSNVSAAQSPTHEMKAGGRHSMMIGGDQEPLVGLCRSKSATALKCADHGVGEDDMNALCQLLCISVAMLESSNDNEYLLALHLLDKILDVSGADRMICLRRLAKTVNQLDWVAFSGIIGLVVKGTVITSGYELSVSLLMKCLDLISEPAIGSVDSIPLIVISVLPLLMLNFDAPTSFCVSVATSLSKYLSARYDETTADNDIPDHPLVHLSVMMRQYAEHCFPRDKFQWSKCVVKYLCDAFTPNITQLVVLLSEMLERGATTFHSSLLHCIFLVFCHGDLSQCPPVPLNAQVIRVVSKHLQTSNWKEAGRILKFVLQVECSPSTTPPKDETQKAVDGQRCLQSEVALSGCATPTSSRKSILDNASLRKHNNYNQARVRERLVSLLNASGLRVGLPKSASIIFSQSSHNVSHEPIGSVSSSTEHLTPSHGGDIETTSSLAADPSVTDSFPRVFREFDFLEAEHDSISESTESCFNWLSTMRPGSLRNADNEREEQYQDDESTETPGERRPTSAASDSNEVSSERTPLPSEAISDTSLEEESCEEELEEDEYINEDEQHRQTDMSSLAESVRCSHSEISVESRRRPLPLFLECEYHSSFQSEQQWVSCIAELNGEDNGEITAHAILVFSQLYRECCVKLSSLLRDINHLFTACSPSRDISKQLADASDLVMKTSDCPFLFVTAKFLRSAGLSSILKCTLLELHEHYETFDERKEQCIRSLNGVKAAVKLAVIGGQSSVPNTSQHLELLKSVHKLFFQLLLMSDKLDEIIKAVENANESQDCDMSSEVLFLHRCLLSSVPDSTHSVDCSMDGEPDCEALLASIQKKLYKNALCTVRQLRQRYGREFGCCEQVEVEVLLLAYCRAHHDACWALIGSHKALSVDCAQLREANMQMGGTVRSLAPEAIALRSSRVSSASESYSRV